MARRRRSARQAASAAVRRERSQRRRKIIATIGVAVVVIAAIGGAALLLRDDSGPQVTSALTGTVVSNSPTTLAIDAAPVSYRLTYRAESESAGGFTTGTQDVVIRRPFDGRLTIHPAEGSTDESDVIVLSQLGLYSYDTGNGSPQVQAGLPTAALGDVRLDGTLDDLVAAGLFLPRERRVVLGRECQVYRTGQLVELMELVAPTDTDYADVCVDAAGLVLEQVMFTDGEAVTYEIVTAIDTQPVVTDDEFSITGDPVSLDLGGTELVPLPADTPPVAGYWAPATTPAGYEHVGRYALRSLAPDDGTTSTTVGTEPPPTVESYVDVYTNGASFVVVHQGDAAQSPGTDTTQGVDVDAGQLGSARIAYGLAGHTLVATTDTWFVEVTATMSAVDLATLATTFEAAPAAG